MVSAGKSKNMLLQYYSLICLMLFLYMFFSVSHSIGSDTISLGRSLSVGHTIFSKGGKFQLGFFSPGNFTNHYIGIWYTNITDDSVVWVANRDNPIPLASSNKSSLVLSNGRLNLYNDLRSIFWTTSSFIGDSNAIEAVLLDTGNFVLRDGLGAVLWQSFDYPTDSWLPGGRVGLDKAANRSLVLTSWRNKGDPGSGIYSLRIDPSGSPELFMWRMNVTRPYWRSGVWNGQNFSLAPNMGVNDLYNFSFVSNAETAYFTYSASGESTMSLVDIEPSGVMLRWVLSQHVRNWKPYSWEPTDSCAAVNEICGPFGICNNDANPLCSCLEGFRPRLKKDWEQGDFSSGCVRINLLQCTNNTESFVLVPNVYPASNSQSLEVESAERCEIACLDICYCNAYSYNISGGCFLWTGDLLDLQQRSYEQDFYLKLDDPKFPDAVNASEGTDPFQVTGNEGSRNKKKLHMAIGISIALVLVTSGSILCFLWPRRRKLKRTETNGKNQDLLLLNLDNSNKANTHSINKSGEDKKVIELPMFSFSSISAATNKFSATNKLGEGGFGLVYKGSLVNGQSVAVKRLSKMSGQGLEELRNEAILIAKLQHRNLVRLLGCCTEKDEKILIYEYMPNKSLDSFLFDLNKQELLNWSRRVLIIEGIAQGLLYLHEYSRLRIVHRDLKASNILLDGDMNPKISDFGMARIFGGNQLQAYTNRIVGTYGYMSPEYAMEGRFSVKSDVFAFGVLLLEILSGKKNTSFHHLDCLSLLGYAWELWENERALELIDPILQIPSSSSMPLRYILVGLLCVQDSPEDRPTISDVLVMLSNEHTTLASPKRPAFTTGQTLLFASSDRGKAENCSINDLTTSIFEARGPFLMSSATASPVNFRPMYRSSGH